MVESLHEKLIITISSRALFDLNESHAVYETQGVDAYASYQIHQEDNILQPGIAFGLVKKLLHLHHPITQLPLVEVVLLSRNSTDTGLRIFNSIAHHKLNITRAVFTSGQSPYPYVQAFGSHLFLSADPSDVYQSLVAGCAAATILPSKMQHSTHDQLRIAFDGDAVIFSDEAEKIFEQHGLAVFNELETHAARTPLNDGPLKHFLQGLHRLQQYFPGEQSPIRTALVTARSAPAHERVIRTLREWNIRIDEAIFLGGLEKGQFLQAFGADFFFDDKVIHCESASQHVATAQVPRSKKSGS